MRYVHLLLCNTNNNFIEHKISTEQYTDKVKDTIRDLIAKERSTPDNLTNCKQITIVHK